MDKPAILALFDIDATLLNSCGCGRVAVEAAMRQLLDWRGDIGDHELSGKIDWQVLAELGGLDDDTIAELMPDYERAVSDHLARIIDRYDVAPCAGALDLIEALAARSDVFLGIVTGNVYAVARLKLRTAGFNPALFRAGGYGGDAPRREMLPPLAVERAHALTSVQFAGERIVVIGDTPNDMICARSVEARTVAVLTGKWSREDMTAHEPDTIFEDLRDTPAAVQAILGV